MLSRACQLFTFHWKICVRFTRVIPGTRLSSISISVCICIIVTKYILGSAVVAVVTAGHNTQLWYWWWWWWWWLVLLVVVAAGGVGVGGVGAPYLLSALMTLTTRQSQSPPRQSHYVTVKTDCSFQKIFNIYLCNRFGWLLEINKVLQIILFMNWQLDLLSIFLII